MKFTLKKWQESLVSETKQGKQTDKRMCDELQVQKHIAAT